MRKLTARGVILEQYKEPAISHPIESFFDVKTVFLPISEKICVSPNQPVKRGQLVSEGIYPETVDSFSSINGTASYVGGFDCEKFEGRHFLQVDAAESAGLVSSSEFEPDDPSDEALAFATENSGIINATDKKTLKEVFSQYQGGVENLVIDAVDDEPYVSNKIAQLFFRADQIGPAIRAINRVLGAKNIRIEVYGYNGDISVKIPQKAGRYEVRQIKEKYPVCRRMKSDSETVYIDIEALLGFYYSALEKKAWTNTVVTVAGDCVKKPCNIEVPIGTSIGDILNYCGLNSMPKTIVLGGSMTGYIVDGTDIPVLRTTKAILAFSKELCYESTECIGCGRCIDVCPEKLLPYYIYTYYCDNNIEKLYQLSAEKCTECGCCSYICPAKIDLRQFVKKSRRTLLKEMWENEQSGQDNQSTVSEKQ